MPALPAIPEESDASTPLPGVGPAPVAPGGPAGFLRLAALGFLSSAMLAVCIKHFTVKFPIDLTIVGIWLYVGLGMPLGALAGAGGAERLKRWTPAMAGALLLYLGSTLVNQNVTVHYLLGEVYYPYPLPEKPFLRVGGFFTALALCPAFFFIAGMLFGDAFKRSSNAAAAHAAFVLGMALGAPAGHYVMQSLGGYVPAFLGGAALLLMLGDRRWAAAGVVACVGAIAFVSSNDYRVFYAWKLEKFNHQSERWTDYYRIDFISFSPPQATMAPPPGSAPPPGGPQGAETSAANDPCMGGVYNTLMLWYVCGDPDLMATEFRRLMAAVAPGKKTALLAGRTDGNYPSLVLRANPEIEKFVSVDYDPVAARMMSGPYAKYNGGFFQKPGMEARADDIRQFIRREARDGKRYDLIFLHGIGLRLAPLPRSIIQQEDYLTSRDNYDLIFNKLLTEKGVFVIDWGSSIEDEIHSLRTNIPDDVHARGFHVWMGEFPLTGLPLFYVIASRDKAQLDRIADDLLSMASFREIQFKPKRLRETKFDDDRPFHHPEIAPILLLIAAPAFAVLAAVLIHVGFRERWKFPVAPPYLAFYTALAAAAALAFYPGKVFGFAVKDRGFYIMLTGACLGGFALQYAVRCGLRAFGSLVEGKGRLGAYFTLAGLAVGVAETCVYSRISWLMPKGPGPGVVLVGAAWLTGFSLPLLAAARKPAFPVAAPFAGAVAALAVLPWVLHGIHAPAPALAAAFLLGAVACVPWAGAAPRLSPDGRLRAFCLFGLGSLVGLYLFQWLVFLTGYRMTGVAAGALFLLTALAYARLCKETTWRNVQHAE